MPAAHAILTAALGDELTESEASVRVFLTAGGLAILGFVLLLVTIWWWRGTKEEPTALGPLEVMGDRRWQHASDHERRRMIDLQRPHGSFELDGRVAPIPIDLSVLARDVPKDFDDLRDDANRWPAFQADGLAAEVAGDELAAEVRPDTQAHAEREPGAGAGLGVTADVTMYEVARPVTHPPEVEAEQSNNDDPHPDDPHPDDPHPDDPRRDDRSDDLAIDPLLQRTPSPD